MRIFPLLALALLPWLPIQTAAQQTPLIAAIGRADSLTASIRLRWAVGRPLEWKQCNSGGFTVERFTVVRNGKMLDRPERKLLTPQPVKPQALDAWASIALTDRYAAVIAQALYGNDFDMSSESNDGLTQIMNLSQELAQRHTFALYAADMSFPAACLAGWGLTDSEVKANEKYLYRIKPAPGKGMPVDSAAVYIGLDDYEPLPAPTEPVAQFGHQSVMLLWDYSRFSALYNAYFVERSADGRHFERLSDVPVGNLNNQPGEAATRMYYLDSLPDNNTPYYYRIIGINPFGQESPPSAAVQGKGRQLLPYVPNIRHAYIDEQGLQLAWEFAEEGNALISGFRLQRSDRIYGAPEVVTDSIAPTLRSLTLKKALSPSNYFTITAIAREGDSRTSQSVLVQPVDSFPPQPPAGLKVLIDTAGRAHLQWTPNTETDLLGYKLFRGMKKEEELSPVTNEPQTAHLFTDSLDRKLLNRRLYYAVAAVDTRFNQSALSEVVEATKPAFVPPSPPLMTRCTWDGGKVRIEWVNTPDEDADSLRIYRKAENESRWELLQSAAARQARAYDDAAVAGNQSYAYVLEVSNEGGLRASSDTLQVKTPASAGRPKQLDGFRIQAQPEQQRICLLWDDRLPDVSGYLVYRAVADQPLSLWKTPAKGEKECYDTQVELNTTYRYAVQAVFTSGAYSEMKTETINY